MAKLDFPTTNPDGSPLSEGDVWKGENGVTYTYRVTATGYYWQGVTSEYTKDSNANIHVGDTPPLDPEPGDLWWDSSNDSGRLYMFYEDVDSTQWVEASPSGTGEDAEDGEPTLWDKNGNDLEPKVATDNVVIGDGNITLRANGTVDTNGRIRTYINTSTGNTNAFSIASNTQANNTTNFSVGADGSVRIGGNIIGSDSNISLNENGSADFAAGLTARGLDTGSTYASLYASGTTGNHLYGAVDSVPTVQIKHDGTASFVGGDVTIDSDKHLSIFTSAGPGGSSSLSIATNQGGNGGRNLFSAAVGATTINSGIKVFTIQDHGNVAIGDVGGNQNISLNGSDGSATFAGTILLGNSPVGGANSGVILYPQGGINISRPGGEAVFIVYSNGSNTKKIDLRSDGSAIFKGTVQTAGGVVTPSMVLQLETDNPTNYTTTTDGEGVETQVYNGPVLDVKALLLTLQTAASRIESLETANASLEARLTALEGAN